MLELCTYGTIPVQNMKDLTTTIFVLSAIVGCSRAMAQAMEYAHPCAEHLKNQPIFIHFIIESFMTISCASHKNRPSLLSSGRFFISNVWLIFRLTFASGKIVALTLFYQISIFYDKNSPSDCFGWGVCLRSEQPAICRLLFILRGVLPMWVII